MLSAIFEAYGSNIMMTNLYGYTLLWTNLLSGLLASGVVAALAAICSQAVGTTGGLRVVLAAGVTVLNVGLVLYLLANRVCEVPPPGSHFTNCRIPPPLGSILTGLALFLSAPAILAAGVAAVRIITPLEMPQVQTQTCRALLRVRPSPRRRQATPGPHPCRVAA